MVIKIESTQYKCCNMFCGRTCVVNRYCDNTIITLVDAETYNARHYNGIRVHHPITTFVGFANYVKIDHSWNAFTYLQYICRYCKEDAYDYVQTTYLFGSKIITIPNGQIKHQISNLCDKCFTNIAQFLAIYERAVMWLFARNLDDDSASVKRGILCTTDRWFTSYQMLRNLLGADVVCVIYDIIASFPPH